MILASLSHVVLANAVRAWVVPAILFVLVLGMGFAGARWLASQQVTSVRSVPLFSGLSDRQLRSVLRSAQEVEFPPGAAIVMEGDRGKSFFLIRRGTARVSVGGEKSAVLQPHAYFGEVSLLDGGPRTAAVTAETQVQAFELTSSSFDRLLAKDAAIARAILDRMSQWLRESGGKIDVPTGSVDRAALAQLGKRLRDARHKEWGGPPAQR